MSIDWLSNLDVKVKKCSVYIILYKYLEKYLIFSDTADIIFLDCYCVHIFIGLS